MFLINSTERSTDEFAQKFPKAEKLTYIICIPEGVNNMFAKET